MRNGRLQLKASPRFGVHGVLFISSEILLQDGLMYRSLMMALLAVSSAPSSGCGTFANVLASSGSVPPAPFGGVRNDFDAMARGNVLFGVDIPFSLIGDLVTLPDILVERSRSRATEEKGITVVEPEEQATAARKQGQQND
jgi:uncharacterized protein YceK